MTDRLDLFSTPVLKTPWPGAQQHNAALIEAINQNRQTSQGLQRHNIGGWHSNIDMAHWGGPSAIALAEFASEVVGDHMTDVHPKGKRNFHWHVEMWANINPPGAAEQFNCQPGAFWTGVYYPDPGGSEVEGAGGELVLEDPRYPKAHMVMRDLILKTSAGEPMLPKFQIRPEPGSIVLFPSWLRHSVNQHLGPRPRVSITLTLMVIETGQAPPPAESA